MFSVGQSKFIFRTRNLLSRCTNYRQGTMWLSVAQTTCSYAVKYVDATYYKLTSGKLSVAIILLEGRCFKWIDRSSSDTITIAVRSCCCYCSSAAVKNNLSTNDCSLKSMEQEIQTWFGNARDRGASGRCYAPLHSQENCCDGYP